jgi:membrane dipeptidase
VPVIPLSLLADHVDHIRRVAGIDHVGLGSDYDGINALPEGMGDVSGYPALLEELAARGWSKDELSKLAGENLLRVMTEVEQVAAELQETEEPVEAWFKAAE